jgi:hypothetical protein
MSRRETSCGSLTLIQVCDLPPLHETRLIADPGSKQALPFSMLSLFSIILIALRDAGLQEVGMHVSQPAGFEGEAKLITPLTMQSIGERVIEAGLATVDEVKRIVEGLTEAALNSTVVMGMSRIFQVWGRKR